MTQVFRRSGVYCRRWQYWYPWSMTRWWMPRLPWRGGDEWCNDSVVIGFWFLGALVIFWRPGPLRTMPCPEERAAMCDEQRADYAPCGQLWGGRIREGAHVHVTDGVCAEAEMWVHANA